MKGLLVVDLMSVLVAQAFCGRSRSRGCDRDEDSSSSEDRSSTLQIVGAGTVEVDPDIVTLTITARGQKRTSIEALSFANGQVGQVNSLLSYFGLGGNNITTARISLSPVYNYQNGNSFLIGQQATSSMKVTASVRTNIGRMIQSISGVSNTTIGGLNFQNQDNSLALSAARKAAAGDALAKAKQYASLTGRPLGAIKKVIDQKQERYIPYALDSREFTLQSQVLSVPFGKVTVSSSVEIHWNI